MPASPRRQPHCTTGGGKFCDEDSPRLQLRAEHALEERVAGAGVGVGRRNRYQRGLAFAGGEGLAEVGAEDGVVGHRSSLSGRSVGEDSCGCEGLGAVGVPVGAGRGDVAGERALEGFVGGLAEWVLGKSAGWWKIARGRPRPPRHNFGGYTPPSPQLWRTVEKPAVEQTPQIRPVFTTPVELPTPNLARFKQKVEQTQKNPPIGRVPTGHVRETLPSPAPTQAHPTSTTSDDHVIQELDPYQLACFRRRALDAMDRCRAVMIGRPLATIPQAAHSPLARPLACLR